MEALSRFCSENELILNMKKGKTEAMLFGTSKRIGNKKMEITYRGEAVNETELYVYLGNLLDQGRLAGKMKWY